MSEKVTIKVERKELHLPTIALRGLVVFPNNLVHFEVGREKSIAAVEWAMANNSNVFLVAQKEMETSEPTQQDLYTYGVVAEVKQVLRVSDELVKVLVEGKYRAKLTELDTTGDFLLSAVRSAPVRAAKPEEAVETEALLRALKTGFDEYLGMNPRLAKDVVFTIVSSDDPMFLTEYMPANLLFRYEDKQAVMNENTLNGRLQRLVEMLRRECQVMKIEKEIAEKVNESMDKNQRDYYLHEQLHIISDELGEGDDTHAEADEYRRKITALHLAEDSEKKLLKEVDRLSRMQSSNQEATVIRTYLDTCLDLPWNTMTVDDLDIHRAQQILDRDHYGLKKVKDRILEFLSVYKLKPEAGGSIMCFAGPPGVGKTSLGRSIARALGRKFERISLGGIHDEAEIRGHRRTYIGALPGRIIQSLRHAGTRNPVIVLDEIDKVGRDVQGDPQSALLEVLDPEQNRTFSDHYLGVPFDLSKVLFLCTANTLDTIPAALRDRMEIIQLPGYTQLEKLEIAKRHLLAKCVEKNGLEAGDVTIPDETIEKVIREYTREAGVRSLERTLGALCRKMARRKAEGEKPPFEVKPDDLLELLGPPVFLDDEDSMTLSPGMCYGLAWTQAGGEVLTIEAAIVKGKGTIQLTGSLGDVMKESAEAATTFLRSQAKQYHFDPDFLAKHDIHIHVPAGATPKDGPSAGVTLTTALLSALIGKAPKSTLCMTGEIDIKGRVLPVGGIKEKILGAVARGLKEAIMASQNKKDLYDIPKDLLKKIKIHPVHRYAEVAKLAFTTAALKGRTAGKREKEQAPVVPLEQSLPGVRVTPEENEKQEAPES